MEVLNQFMFSFRKILLLLVFLALCFSCFQDQPTSTLGQNTGRQNKTRGALPPKAPDPQKQAECRKQSRNTCEDEEECRSVCMDIFTKKSHRKNCEKLPEDFVLAFEHSLKQVEKGDIEDLDLEVLDCLLDIDVRAFTNALKKLSRKEAKNFLGEIAEDEDLAKIIKGEDDNFRIFERLFSEAGLGADLNQILSEEIEDDKSFLQLSAERNRYAFGWLDDYVSEKCQSFLCPQEQNLGAYCAALVPLEDRDLRDFLLDGDLFAREYEQDILNQEFDYDSSGFRRFCSDQFSGSSAGNPRSPSNPDPSPTPDPPLVPSCTENIPDFCSRTAEVQTAILGRISGKTCCTVTQADLDTIVTTLMVPLDPHIRTGYATCLRTATLQAGDLSGLRRLTSINFNSSCLNNLPSGIFSGMTDLREIIFGQTPELGRSHSTDPTNKGFPADVFNGLSNLQTIHMPECGHACSTIPACASAQSRGVTIVEDC